MVVEVLARLGELVAAGGAVAAGADVDLGTGHRSARIDGGAGDRRDAVLAALAVPGFAGRLGPPPALLAALFGPDATKPLGAAALEAITAGRWPVLRYAVAAADLLGPEQLVRLLALRAPEGSTRSRPACPRLSARTWAACSARCPARGGCGC